MSNVVYLVTVSLLALLNIGKTSRRRARGSDADFIRLLSFLFTLKCQGANRPDGIGFATITSLLENPQARTVAAARDPSSALALQELSKSSEGRVVVMKMDVADLYSVKVSL